MNVENKLARILRNTGPARFFIPAGVFLIVFGILSEGTEALLFLAAGALAIVYGIYKTLQAFKKSEELDAAVPGGEEFPAEAFDGFKQADGVAEYYFRWDGNSLKPGYILEDADRNPLYEGKMLKNALVGARQFEFTDHTKGKTAEHEVGHTTTQTYNNEFFSVDSWFKVDGRNIWDILHDRGLRMMTDLHSRFPYLIYQVTKDGKPFARIETTSIYVHEDDEAKHKIVVPAGNMYYRVWTASDDFDSIFLTIFAISETEQAVVE